jgi:transmembrane sensor
MQPLEIRSFLQKFAAGTNTEAEHQQFTDWLKTAPIAEVEGVLDRYNALVTETYLSAGETHPVLISNIEAAIEQYELGNSKKHKTGKIITWHRFTRIAAAALILFITGTATWLVIRKNIPGKTAGKLARQEKNEVAPGGNKATLSLADGSVISLDDVKNGQIAQQGNAQVSKSANGQLIYKVTEDRPSSIVYNTLTTPRGGQFKLRLPDGSEVWLNAASSIKYPTTFAGNERKVEISGEVYFEIAHNASMPFKVSVNGMEVKVLGTHFNINAYNDEAAVKTSLLEGSISLTKAGAALTLKPGQQAQLAFAGNIHVTDDVDMDEVVAWKNGYFSFNMADLQAVMRQIARWYDVDIRYEGKIPERFFGGKIDRNSNASEVLKILEESKVHFSIEGKKIIVKP